MALIKNGKAFEHKFNSVGQFSYFCQLHPDKVGKVIVHRKKIQPNSNKARTFKSRKPGSKY
jgi:hypothetical protein